MGQVVNFAAACRDQDGARYERMRRRVTAHIDRLMKGDRVDADLLLAFAALAEETCGHGFERHEAHCALWHASEHVAMAGPEHAGLARELLARGQALSARRPPLKAG